MSPGSTTAIHEVKVYLVNPFSHIYKHFFETDRYTQEWGIKELKSPVMTEPLRSSNDVKGCHMPCRIQVQVPKSMK